MFAFNTCSPQNPPCWCKLQKIPKINQHSLPRHFFLFSHPSTSPGVTPAPSLSRSHLTMSFCWSNMQNGGTGTGYCVDLFTNEPQGKNISLCLKHNDNCRRYVAWVCHWSHCFSRRYYSRLLESRLDLLLFFFEGFCLVHLHLQSLSLKRSESLLFSVLPLLSALFIVELSIWPQPFLFVCTSVYILAFCTALSPHFLFLFDNLSIRLAISLPL